MPTFAKAPVSKPVRTCRICRTKRPQNELVRWNWQPGGGLVKSTDRIGRGIYSCPGTCTDKLEQHKERFKK